MDRSTFNFHDYMLDCATRLKDIGHTSASPRFFKINAITGLEELINNISTAGYPALCMQTAIRGDIGDQLRSNNFLDNRSLVFYVVGAPLQIDLGGSDLLTEKNKTKAVGFKILAKMKYDRRRQLYGLHFMEFLSVNYEEIGPLGAGSYAIRFNIKVVDSNQLIYNDSDWLEE